MPTQGTKDKRLACNTRSPARKENTYVKRPLHIQSSGKNALTLHAQPARILPRP